MSQSLIRAFAAYAGMPVGHPRHVPDCETVAAMKTLAESEGFNLRVVFVGEARIPTPPNAPNTVTVHIYEDDAGIYKIGRKPPTFS